MIPLSFDRDHLTSNPSKHISLTLDLHTTITLTNAHHAKDDARSNRRRGSIRPICWLVPHRRPRLLRLPSNQLHPSPDCVPTRRKSQCSKYRIGVAQAMGRQVLSRKPGLCFVPYRSAHRMGYLPRSGGAGGGDGFDGLWAFPVVWVRLRAPGGGEHRERQWLLIRTYLYIICGLVLEATPS